MVTQINHATYTRDGRSIFDVKSHMTYIVYSLIYLLLFFLAQLPADYKIEVNTDLICEAVTFVDEDGNRRPVPEWVFGPGRRTHQTADQQEVVRKQMVNEWKSHYQRQSSILPVVQVEEARKGEWEHGIIDAQQFLISSGALKGRCWFFSAGFYLSVSQTAASLKARKDGMGQENVESNESGQYHSVLWPLHLTYHPDGKHGEKDGKADQTPGRYFISYSLCKWQ